jgi:methanogenic corrinoid protein MtbC1
VEVLRAWEQRYAVVEPVRSKGGRRLYSSGDIDRLSLLARAVDRGLRIGDARRMDDAGLRTFLAERAPDGAKRNAQPARSLANASTEGSPRLSYGAAEDRAAAQHLAACKKAVLAFDSAALARALARANVSLALRKLVDEVVAPLLAWTGERWSEGSLCVAQEHMASTVVRSKLLADVSASGARPDAPCIVITTPSSELHELGALLAALAAASMGWRVEYLGPNLPAREIALAVRRCGASVVALSIARRAKDATVVGELKDLRKLVGKKIPVLVGGNGANAYAEAIEAAGARQFSDCWSFASYLESREGASR